MSRAKVGTACLFDSQASRPIGQEVVPTRLQLFECAKELVSQDESLMTAEQEMELLEAIDSSFLPQALKRQIGKLSVEHRLFKRGLVHYANPGNYYQDVCYSYHPYDEDGEMIAIEEVDLGETARMILGIADGWPAVPGFGIETAEALLIPYWPHDPGSLFGIPPPVEPEMSAPLHEDVTLRFNKMYDKAQSRLLGDRLETEKAAGKGT